MMNTSILIRIRFAPAVIERLDALVSVHARCLDGEARKDRAVLKRRVSRAAVIRALVMVGLDGAAASELASVIGADPVRRGRVKGEPQGKRHAKWRPGAG